MLRICNAYCVFTATKVARTRLSVTLYVHCLSCWSFFIASTAQDTVKDNLFSQNLLPNSTILFKNQNKIFNLLLTCLWDS